MVYVSSGTESRREQIRAELRRRTERPQRHRLLQGYPMAPLMHPLSPVFDPLRRAEIDPTRALLVGVLPHTFCNPKVRGCGFCTFPHEKFGNEAMRTVLAQVQREIEGAAERQPALRGRAVEAVYLGGGTANLTPPEDLARLCDALASAFDLRGSELTLEGIPRYFLLRDEALLDVLAAAGVRHRRVSMGVQTFDPVWLARMGRDAFGDRDEIARVVESAHRRGFTASADLLFNLPGAPIERALDDVATAAACGFDQVCVYNLVLTPDLGTPWANERSLLDAMPDGSRALGTWLAVRAALLDRGYVQTTLTNFERADVANSPRAFAYERASFDPATRDALGFGPGAISTFTAPHGRGANKWINQGGGEAYARAMEARGAAVASSFEYSPLDLRLLHLTRSLSRLAIDCEAYERFFGTDPLVEFREQFQALEDARLVRVRARSVEPTPEGMFYADAVAGLLSSGRAGELRGEAEERERLRDHMG